MEARERISLSAMKRIKRVMNLQQKVRILDHLVGGMTTAAVSRKYGVNESTIRCIRGQEHKIRQLAYRYPCAKRAQFSKREILLTKMEGMLVDWIADKTTENSRPNAKAICKKAVELFNVVKSHATDEEIGDRAMFIASRGWFNNFRKRHLARDLSLRTSPGPEDVAKYDTVPSPTFEMINSPTSDAGNVKPEPIDCEDSQTEPYPGVEKQEPYRVFISPLYQTNTEDRCDEDSSRVDYNEDTYGNNGCEPSDNHNDEDLCNGDGSGVIYDGDRYVRVASNGSEPSDNEPESNDTCGRSVNPNLSMENLKVILNMVKTLKGYITEIDPDGIRSSCASGKIEGAFAPYVELYGELKERASQPRITQFFKPLASSRRPSINSETNSYRVRK